MFRPTLSQPSVGQAALTSLQQQSEKLILVKFVAPFCIGCVTLRPLLEKLVQDNSDHLELLEIDITKESQMAVNFDVRLVPTVVLFQQEQEMGRLAKLQPAKRYINLVRQAFQDSFA